MRAIVKLSLLIVATILTQRGLNAVRENAAEVDFEWRLEMAMLRGLPMTTPEFMDLAEPLLGFTACHADADFSEASDG